MCVCVCVCAAERSTDNAASAGNIALHLQICDAVNETDNGCVWGGGGGGGECVCVCVCSLTVPGYRPKDAVAAIRKRLTGSSKNFHIINLTLTVRVCV